MVLAISLILLFALPAIFFMGFAGVVLAKERGRRKRAMKDPVIRDLKEELELQNNILLELQDIYNIIHKLRHNADMWKDNFEYIEHLENAMKINSSQKEYYDFIITLNNQIKIVENLEEKIEKRLENYKKPLTKT